MKIFIFRLNILANFLILTTLNIFILSVFLLMLYFLASLSAVVEFTKQCKECFSGEKGFYYVFQPYFKFCKTYWQLFKAPTFNK